VDVRPHLSDLVVPFPFDARRVLGRTAWVENIRDIARGEQRDDQEAGLIRSFRDAIGA
jgi:hypothetical protein